ncbi:MAG TPA: cytochrome c oxidase subunit 3 [Gaiellaceae bacterium]|nr:cytochrome c oxidase subunit 3 [Gaiellaceae bacterium]
MTRPFEALTVPKKQASLPRGIWGLILFVASEGTLFGVIFGSYFYLRFKSVHWPPEGIPAPSTVVPLILAGVLATTSVPMQLAYAAVRAGRARLGQLFLFVALFVQCGYFAMQMHLFVHEVHAHPPQLHAYTSITQLMEGADHFHVFVGILLNLFLIAKLLDGRITGYRLTGVRAGAYYWHFVNLLTLFVVGAQLSPSV